MSTAIPIRCFCGRFEGVANDMSTRAGFHLTCYCEDCQSFQHALGQASRVLDVNGGTAIFQTSPGRLQFTRGLEYLSCLRLGPKGPVRWYTSCCNTPIGNTLWTPAVPFIGIITACFDRSLDAEAVSDALGPERPGVFGKFALGNRADIDAHDTVPMFVNMSFLVRLLGWRLKDGKSTPFFDRETKEIVAEPWMLSKAEREQAANGEQLVESGSAPVKPVPGTKNHSGHARSTD